MHNKTYAHTESKSILSPVLTAVLAHVPCCGPAVLAAFGATTVSAGWLAWLEPFRPWLIALSAIQVLWLFGWARWGRRPDCCKHHISKARSMRYRTAWVTLAFVVGVNALGCWVDLAHSADHHGHAHTHAGSGH